MKTLMGILTVLVVISCSTNKSDKPKLDEGGAQKQEAMYDETRNEQDERIRNQFPGARPF